jgi:polyhydroxybutyrate depolymerase
MKHLALILVVALSLAACSSSAKKSAAPPVASPVSTVPATGAAVPSAGCGTSTARTEDAQRHTMTVSGQQRFYLLTVPAAHDGHTPLPLVLDFHGLAEGAVVHTKMSEFGTLAKQQGFVVAFPNGTGQPVSWNLAVPPKPNADLEYVDQLLEGLEHDLCIDTSRVYADGLSLGAFMTSFVACTRANKFAAVAPVAGVTIFDGCTPSRPVPLLAFHGTADPILHFNGGVGPIPGVTSPVGAQGATTTLPKADLNGPGYPAAVAKWAARNGCDATPTDTSVTKEVIHRVYHCPAGQDVEFYIIIGGGHAWPGSQFSKSIANAVGYTTMDINATNLIWDFFKRFQLRA